MSMADEDYNLCIDRFYAHQRKLNRQLEELNRKKVLTKHERTKLQNIKRELSEMEMIEYEIL